MEKSILKLLKKLDSEYPKRVNSKTLVSKLFSYKIIIDSYNWGLIDTFQKISEQDKLTETLLSRGDDGYDFWITPKGFELLNQLNLKDAIMNFNKSSDNFNITLGNYTYLLLIFTVIIAMASLVSLYVYAVQGIVTIYLFYTMLFVFIGAYILLMLQRKRQRSNQST